MNELFSLEFPMWQMVLRGTAVYGFLVRGFRFVLRRDIGSTGVADLLFVVLAADASSNAMQREYRTVSDGLVLVLTLIAWNFALDQSSFPALPSRAFLSRRRSCCSSTGEP